jgi:hypothetical protein
MHMTVVLNRPSREQAWGTIGRQSWLSHWLWDRVLLASVGYVPKMLLLFIPLCLGCPPLPTRLVCP